MPLYRVLSPLSFGERVVRPGTLHRLQGLSPKAVDALTRRGAVAPVASPPLRVLPGWQVRAHRLSRHGILDALAYLDTPPETVAAWLGVKPATAERWQAEVERWLTAEPPERTG